MSNKSFFLNATSYDGWDAYIKLFGMPDSCPACHKGQEFDDPYSIRLSRNNKGCFAFLQCRFTDCRTPFFSYYYELNGKYIYRGTEVPSYVEPLEDSSDLIMQISPNYNSIFAQSHQAEENGLDLIAGGGYRKALEFLIKDYCIYLIQQNHEMDEDEKAQAINNIKKAFLGNVIKNDLKMPKVKSLAERATWLGNDETHYERRIENGDISIMKSLMRLVIHFIEAEEEAKKLEKEIQPSL